MDTVTGVSSDYAEPKIHKIRIADLRDALRQGIRDYASNRSDVLFLCLIYPLLMYTVVRLAFGYGVIPLIFPIVSGCALLGPVVAVGLYHVSWRREQGLETHWRDAFQVFRLPGIGSIAVLSVLLATLFMAWLAVAITLYQSTVGSGAIWFMSPGEFLADVFGTPQGWLLIAAGNLLGLLFAGAVLSISVISFPLLVDRDVGPVDAVLTSLRVVAANPVPMAVWGLMVSGLLLLGALPFFVGLAVAMPVLGHATWHLYRKVVTLP
jgi:uncharacterized membrane protein